MKQNFLVSFFEKPIWEKNPVELAVSLYWVFQRIISKIYEAPTNELRKISEEGKQRDYKGRNFDWITPAGTFLYDNDSSLISYSGMLGIDLDHLDDCSQYMKRKIGPEDMKQLLLKDPYFGEQTLMMFTSPRGHGVKWFVQIDLTKCDYNMWFNALRSYLMTTYGLGDKQVDSTVANISHACFLCYDPQAYLRKDLYEQL